MLLTENTRTTHLLKKKKNTHTDHNRRQNIKAVNRTNKIIKDHHENYLIVNRITSTYCNVARNKKKNIMLFTDSILKALSIGELNCLINSGKVHFKSFPGSKANQLNHHAMPILEEHQDDSAAIHVGTNDLLKGMLIM